MIPSGINPVSARERPERLEKNPTRSVLFGLQTVAKNRSSILYREYFRSHARSRRDRLAIDSGLSFHRIRVAVANDQRSPTQPLDT